MCSANAKGQIPHLKLSLRADCCPNGVDARSPRPRVPPRPKLCRLRPGVPQACLHPLALKQVRRRCTHRGPGVRLPVLEVLREHVSPHRVGRDGGSARLGVSLPGRGERGGEGRGVCGGCAAAVLVVVLVVLVPVLILLPPVVGVSL